MRTETSYGVIIPRQPEAAAKGPAFDTEGLPTAAYVDEYFDPVIAELHLIVGQAIYREDREKVIDTLTNAAYYADIVKAHGTMEKLSRGKENILEAVFDQGFSYLQQQSTESSRQLQA